MSNKYKLLLAYEGTAYAGWQVQPDAVTIQELIQKALKTILRDDISVVAAGRTDAGVHAIGQVAHFQCEKTLDTFRFRHSLNGLLPGDIRILAIEPAHPDFHARNSALGKVYHYNLHLNFAHDPFKRRTSFHLRDKLDLDLMAECAKYFVGTHDFTSFANQAYEGAASKDAVRTIKRIDLVPKELGLCLEFEGDGFLYKMVRNITGTILDVASGKIALQKIPEIMAGKDRRQAGQAAPAHGLFLMRVDYPEDLIMTGNIALPCS
jgi:tRNA pseudouridine38-40 synthase